MEIDEDIIKMGDEIERLINELREARAEIERLGARCLKLYKANEKQYKTIMHDLEEANKQETECNYCKGIGLGRSTLGCHVCEGTGRTANKQGTE